MKFIKSTKPLRKPVMRFKQYIKEIYEPKQEANERRKKFIESLKSED